MLKPETQNFECERSTMTMKTPAKVVGFPEKSLRQDRASDRRRRRPDIEACGCRKDDHLSGCHIDHGSVRELFTTATEIENGYDPVQGPSTSRQPEAVHHNQPSYHPSVDVFDDNDDDNEVIGPTPERSRGIRRPRGYLTSDYHPRRLLHTTQQDMSSTSDEVIPDSRTHDNFPNRRRQIRNHRQATQHLTHRILPSTSREYFYDSEEVIPRSPEREFPRRRRNVNSQRQARNSQELIELVNQTIQDTALTVREHLEAIENKFDQMTLILNSSSNAPITGHEPAQQLRDTGIQYDVAGISDEISPRNISVRGSALRDAGMVTEPVVVEQQLLASEVTTEQDRSHRTVAKNVRVTKRIRGETSRVEQDPRRQTTQQSLNATSRDDDVVFQTVSFHSVRHADGSQMTMTTQTQRVADDLRNDAHQPSAIYADNWQERAAIIDDPNWRRIEGAEGNIRDKPKTKKRVDIRDDRVCDTSICVNCTLPKIPVPVMVTTPRRIPTSTPVRTPARQVTDPGIPSVQVTPPSPSPAQPTPIHPSVLDATFDVQRPTFASQPVQSSHLESGNLGVTETSQPRTRRKYGSQSSRRHEVPTHTYDLRPRPLPVRVHYGEQQKQQKRNSAGRQ